MGNPTVIEGDSGDNGAWGFTETSYNFDDPEQLQAYCKATNCTKEQALDPNRWTSQTLRTTLIHPNRKAPPK